MTDAQRCVGFNTLSSRDDEIHRFDRIERASPNNRLQQKTVAG